MNTATEFTKIEGGVTAAKGFRAAGIHCGIKEKKKDLALVVCDTLASAAGMFTTNAVRAAPVLFSQERIQSGVARAIIVNSGNANACTGVQGMRDAAEMAALTAQALGVAEEFVLVASTGVIGIPLPMAPVRSGIPVVVTELSIDGGTAAEAILTTDAFPKIAAVKLEIAGEVVTIGGMAKGAGMIHPQMATTLAFVATDAAMPAPLLRKALRHAVNASFNCISVDGDTSTNDSIFLLGSGLAAHPPILEENEQFARFRSALTEVTTQLAKLVVRDGEGATKVVTLTMKGAPSVRDAKLAAHAAMTSPLVKTMFYGGEPNWGRLLAAVGRSGAPVVEDRVSVWIGGVQVVRNGVGIAPNLPHAAKAMHEPEFEIVIDLQQGNAEFTGWTSDLNDAYVKINAGYMT
ncbi:MAG: bifunctional glutamate N-acetyltransferase/amino-acid acetyltransferase ArgJ [bacterium]